MTCSFCNSTDNVVKMYDDLLDNTKLFDLVQDKYLCNSCLNKKIFPSDEASEKHQYIAGMGKTATSQIAMELLLFNNNAIDNFLNNNNHTTTTVVAGGMQTINEGKNKKDEKMEKLTQRQQRRDQCRK